MSESLVGNTASSFALQVNRQDPLKKKKKSLLGRVECRQLQKNRRTQQNLKVLRKSFIISLEQWVGQGNIGLVCEVRMIGGDQEVAKNMNILKGHLK